VGLSVLTLGVGQMQSPLDSDDQVIFFPTVGHWDSDQREWVLPIHGWVFEPEEDSVKRGVLLGAFRRGLGLSSEQAQTGVFKRRARAFLVDNERAKRITLRIGERDFPLGLSEANGHFQETIRLTADAVKRLRIAAPDAGYVLPFRAIVPAGNDGEFAGQIALVEEAGVSVVSDIDDTIKITEVRNRKTMLRRTFLEEFEAVPGVAAAYSRWHKQGAAFHYVSAGPWQLFPSLDQFRQSEGFPPGSFHMKLFRAKDASFFDLFADADRTKLAAIEPLFERFPRRRFVLVGDSGERDPEIYGDLARRYPELVVAIFIRDVTGEDHSALRYRDAFRGFPAEKWRIFTDAKDLEAFSLIVDLGAD
jgi:hypothetical protein